MPSGNRTFKFIWPLRVIQGHSYWHQEKQDLVLSYKRHNNVDLISETYKDITLGKLQIRRFNHSTPVWWQFSKKRLRISTSNLCYQKLESLSNILSLIMWMYLHSIFCGEIRKTHLFCNCVLICCSRSSKVDDFGINWKRIRDFLLVIRSSFGPYLSFTVSDIQWLIG